MKMEIEHPVLGGGHGIVQAHPLPQELQSPNFVYINGTSVATKGSQTSESASSCRYPSLSNGSGSGTGTVSQGSNFVYVGGNPIAERGHNVNTHSGSGSITSANSFVYVA